jgi:predicted transcriptional regulator
MKTITLKADEAFDALLSQLAAKLETTRSAVIRDAVISYERHLQMDALRRQVREGRAERGHRPNRQKTIWVLPMTTL